VNLDAKKIRGWILLCHLQQRVAHAKANLYRESIGLWKVISDFKGLGCKGNDIVIPVGAERFALGIGGSTRTNNKTAYGAF
jgi:hypothetical protein